VKVRVRVLHLGKSYGGRCSSYLTSEDRCALSRLVGSGCCMCGEFRVHPRRVQYMIYLFDDQSKLPMELKQRLTES
jgi:hypothetical protein